MPRRTLEPWYRPQSTEEICALCGRVIPAAQRDEHHLVPKSRGGRETTALHRICHRQLHALFTEAQLASQYSTIDALLSNDKVRHFVKWVSKKPPEFYERTRRSAEKGQ